MQGEFVEILTISVNNDDNNEAAYSDFSDNLLVGRRR